jgi:hypothetical protein
VLSYHLRPALRALYHYVIRHFLNVSIVLSWSVFPLKGEAKTDAKPASSNLKPAALLLLAAPSPASGIITVTATSGTSDVLHSVAIFADATPIGSCNNSPCRPLWDTNTVSDGIHQVTATAELRGTVVRSTPIAVEIQNSLPQVKLFAPSPASGVVDLQIDATCNCTLARLDLYLDGTLRQQFQNLSTFESATAVTQYAWDSREVANGDHTFRGVAVDSNGKQGVSPDTVVSVMNADPTATPTPTPTVAPVTPTAAAPVTTSIDPAILDLWETHMVEWGRTHCDKLAADQTSTDPNIVADMFYDGERVYFQIADYTGDASWNQCAQYAEKLYKDYVNRGNGVAGWYIFTRGLLMDWQRTGDTDSRDKVIWISKNAAYAPDYTPSAWTVSEVRSREVAYNIDAELDAETLGEPHRARTDLFIGQAMGHIDQWSNPDPTVYTVTSAVSNSTTVPLNATDASLMSNGAYLKFTDHVTGATQTVMISSSTSTVVTMASPVTLNQGDTATVDSDFAPFMLALTAQALIQANEQHPDPRIPPKILAGLEYAWTSMWHDSGPTSGGSTQTNSFYYRKITGQYMAADLNLLIAPAYSWAWKQTGDPKWRDRADLIFKGGVTQAWLGAPKQFNQNYRWSFDYVAARK